MDKYALERVQRRHRSPLPPVVFWRSALNVVRSIVWGLCVLATLLGIRWWASMYALLCFLVSCSDDSAMASDFKIKAWCAFGVAVLVPAFAALGMPRSMKD